MLSGETGMNLLEVLISLGIGGIIGTVITIMSGYFAKRKDRHIQFLEESIRKLYGPVYYFISQTEKLFELSKKMHGAYRSEFEIPAFSFERHTQDILGKETSTTIEIANQYIKQVIENNEQIKKILDENYSFIDPADIDIVMLFFEHYVRLATERDEEGVLKTPHRVYRRIGNISFLRPEVITHIKNSFFAKKRELERLTRPSFIRRLLGKNRRKGVRHQV